MWLKAQNEMAGLWPHAAMGPVERMVRRRVVMRKSCIYELRFASLKRTLFARV